MATQSSTFTSSNNLAFKASTQGNMPTGPAVVRPRAYKDFLTPAMHRRFTSATLMVLAFCWLEAVLMSSGGFFWSWFPLGFTGIRTLLLFLPCLGVFIVRLANLHVGERTTTSGFETLLQVVTDPKTLNTLMWYIYSAFFFGEIYIWSQGNARSLGMVDQGRAYERPRLNENPIILRTFYVVLAITRTFLHLYGDYDQMSVLDDAPVRIDDGPWISRLPKSLRQLRYRIHGMMMRVLNLTIFGLISISPIYFLFVRHMVWSGAYFVARMLYSQLPKNASYTGLTQVTTLTWQAASSSIMLGFLWELSNAAFTIFVSEAPLKKGQPLTSEIKDNAGNILSRSNDPNGSLLTGLQSKKETPRTYAFWELYLICKDFGVRRKTIFSEVERNGGSTWVQVSKACLDEVEAIRRRICVSQQPIVSQSQSSQTAAQGSQASTGLPKIANQRVQDGDVLTKPKADLRSTVGTLAKSIGQSPGANSPASPYARKAIGWGADRVMSKDQQAQLSRQGINREASGYMVKVLQSHAGSIFRETFARRVKAVVYGIPHSNQVNITHAVRCLAALLLASLEEDTYGQVAKDIPNIVRTLTGTIREIQALVATLGPSWTDVEFDTKRDREVAEVQVVVDEIKSALEQILLRFGEYAGSLGLSKKEVREAKEAVGQQAFGREMIQARS